METVLIVVAFILAVVGIAGSVVPGLPGPPLSCVALLLLSFSSVADYPVWLLVVAAVLAVVITVLDYVIPSQSTRKRGGSKAGVWGCNIGLVISIIGLPFGPQGLLGVVFWPFVGAMIGELLSGKKFKEAIRAAWGTFLGFLTGMGLKLVYTIAVAIVMVASLF